MRGSLAAAPPPARACCAAAHLCEAVGSRLTAVRWSEEDGDNGEDVEEEDEETKRQREMEEDLRER